MEVGHGTSWWEHRQWVGVALAQRVAGSAAADELQAVGMSWEKE